MFILKTKLPFFIPDRIDIINFHFGRDMYGICLLKISRDNNKDSKLALLTIITSKKVLMINILYIFHIHIWY